MGPLPRPTNASRPSRGRWAFDPAEEPTVGILRGRFGPATDPVRPRLARAIVAGARYPVDGAAGAYRNTRSGGRPVHCRRPRLLPEKPFRRTFDPGRAHGRRSPRVPSEPLFQLSERSASPPEPTTPWCEVLTYG